MRPPESKPIAVLTLLALLSALVLCSVTIAQTNSASNRSHNQAQLHLNPHTIRVPVVDGNDIRLRFTRLSTENGLSQTKVMQIVQDNQGFMWFATQHGLNRYDGYNFKVFAHDPANPNSLSGVYINALFKDRDPRATECLPQPTAWRQSAYASSTFSDRASGPTVLIRA